MTVEPGELEESQQEWDAKCARDEQYAARIAELMKAPDWSAIIDNWHAAKLATFTRSGAEAALFIAREVEDWAKRVADRELDNAP